MCMCFLSALLFYYISVATDEGGKLLKYESSSFSFYSELIENETEGGMKIKPNFACVIINIEMKKKTLYI